MCCSIIRNLQTLKCNFFPPPRTACDCDSTALLVCFRHEVPVTSDPITIVHMDEDIVVVNKPASIPVSGQQDCLLSLSISLFLYHATMFFIPVFSAFLKQYLHHLSLGSYNCQRFSILCAFTHIILYKRAEVITVSVVILWAVMSHGLVGGYQSFRRTYNFRLYLNICSFKTLVTI